ncbi:MAG: nicotinate-nucleotide adenylyltransferase [Acidimicrobiales bacterium]
MSLEEPDRPPQTASSAAPAQSQQPRRIGLFGGTFDPPHIGHLIVAEAVRDTLHLDEIRWIVANDPWQKTSDRRISDADVRLAMVRAALDGAPGMEASDVEIRLGGASYSIVTLEHLRSAEPDTEWLLIVGADAASGLDTWHRADELADMVEVVVVNRPGECDDNDAGGTAPPGWRWQPVEVPAIGVSSTDLRRRVATGRSIRFLTPAAVADIIDTEQLYRQPR